MFFRAASGYAKSTVGACKILERDPNGGIAQRKAPNTCLLKLDNEKRFHGAFKGRVHKIVVPLSTSSALSVKLGSMNAAARAQKQTGASSAPKTIILPRARQNGDVATLKIVKSREGDFAVTVKYPAEDKHHHPFLSKLHFAKLSTGLNFLRDAVKKTVKNGSDDAVKQYKSGLSGYTSKKVGVTMHTAKEKRRLTEAPKSVTPYRKHTGDSAKPSVDIDKTELVQKDQTSPQKTSLPKNISSAKTVQPQPQEVGTLTTVKAKAVQPDCILKNGESSSAKSKQAARDRRVWRATRVNATINILEDDFWRFSQRSDERYSRHVRPAAVLPFSDPGNKLSRVQIPASAFSRYFDTVLWDAFTSEWQTENAQAAWAESDVQASERAKPKHPWHLVSNKDAQGQNMMHLLLEKRRVNEDNARNTGNQRSVFGEYGLKSAYNQWHQFDKEFGTRLLDQSGVTTLRMLGALGLSCHELDQNGVSPVGLLLLNNRLEAQERLDIYHESAQQSEHYRNAGLDKLTLEDCIKSYDAGHMNAMPHIEAMLGPLSPSQCNPSNPKANPLNQLLNAEEPLTSFAVKAKALMNWGVNPAKATQADGRSFLQAVKETYDLADTHPLMHYIKQASQIESARLEGNSTVEQLVACNEKLHSLGLKKEAPLSATEARDFLKILQILNNAKSSERDNRVTSVLAAVPYTRLMDVICRLPYEKESIDHIKAEFAGSKLELKQYISTVNSIKDQTAKLFEEKTSDIFAKTGNKQDILFSIDSLSEEPALAGYYDQRHFLQPFGRELPDDLLLDEVSIVRQDNTDNFKDEWRLASASRSVV